MFYRAWARDVGTGSWSGSEMKRTGTTEPHFEYLYGIKWDAAVARISSGLFGSETRMRDKRPDLYRLWPRGHPLAQDASFKQESKKSK